MAIIDFLAECGRQDCACFLWSCFPENIGWWRKGMDFIRWFDSTPITHSDWKSFSFAISNFSYMVQFQLSSSASPVCSSSQCFLKIYAVVKEADLVRQDIFPLWALWYIKVLSVWHLLPLLYDFFPIFLFCTYAIIVIPVEWFLLQSGVKQESYTLLALLCYQITGKQSGGNQHGREQFYCVLIIAMQLRCISNLLYNPTSS